MTASPNRKKNYYSIDITGQSFGRLTALRPTEKRAKKGTVIWHCRCTCGNEVDVSYNDLVYTNLRSCGCQKKEHDAALPGYLTHVDGTSIDMLRSRKIPADNTSGYKGVYFIRGKYTAKIVFQKKQYHLGSFDTPEEAAHARREAEKILFDGTAEYYEKWKERAKHDPAWAEANPVRIRVEKTAEGKLEAIYEPELSSEQELTCEPTLD